MRALTPLGTKIGTQQRRSLSRAGTCRAQRTNLHITPPRPYAPSSKPSICFSLRDSHDNLVACATSPPIMITDDHKSTQRKPKPSPASMLAAVTRSERDVPTYSKKKGYVYSTWIGPVFLG